ncbi:amidohydrolase [Arthrobacter sp. NPDC080073]|uniref:amidohydrolase n=1 Tax=Arthrobacter sp. NPDC080073 TaxID=3155919 RepID=UPI003417DC08
MKLDLIIKNANIITLDDQRPKAHSMGVWNEQIVGLDGDIEGLGAARTIDAGGATVTPGFYDVHNHMAAFGQQLQEIDASGFTSCQELYDAVAGAVSRSPEEEWITGSGYDQTMLGGHPERTKLDNAARGRKVVFIHRTSHMLVASSPVFEAVGAMLTSYPVAAGGFIERDDGGRPTGLVAEQAMAPFRDLRKPFGEAALVSALGLANDRYVAEGLTSVTEAGIGASPIVGSSPVEFAAYQRGHDSGRIRVRTQLMVAMENFHSLVAAPTDGYNLGLDLGIRTGLGNGKLSVGPVKIFTDGALMSRTASMTENFCGHDHAGIMQFGFEELRDLAVQAHRGGWQLAVHAIGDHAVDIALDVIDAASRSLKREDPRHRIEHASVVRPDQLERFVRLGVIPSPQGRFVYEIGDGVAEVIGADRLPWTYRHKSFLDAGLTVPGSSDRPVVKGAPLLAMQAMAERMTVSGKQFSKHEAVSAFEALKSYTVHSAYASREEDIKGRLMPRFLADFVILDQDPTAVPVASIGSTNVVGTFVGGKAEYDPSGLMG